MFFYVLPLKLLLKLQPKTRQKRKITLQQPKANSLED